MSNSTVINNLFKYVVNDYRYLEKLGVPEHCFCWILHFGKKDMLIFLKNIIKYHLQNKRYETAIAIRLSFLVTCLKTDFIIDEHGEICIIRLPEIKQSCMRKILEDTIEEILNSIFKREL